MYNPYQYPYTQQGQQNFMQPWTQNQQPQWSQTVQPAPAPQQLQPEPQAVPMMQPTSDIAQAIHRLCDILEAQRGGQSNV